MHFIGDEQYAHDICSEFVNNLFYKKSRKMSIFYTTSIISET